MAAERKRNILPISILIPTMNRPETLERTLNCYINSEWLPSQIVVVDQSKDSYIANQIRDIVNNVNDAVDAVYVYQEIESLTKARNIALEYAEEDIIICSDDDIDVYQDTLKCVYDIMMRKDVALIAGLDDNMPRSSTDIGYLLGTKSFIYRNIGHVTKSVLGRFPDQVNEETETMWAMGFFFIVRKSLIERWHIKWDENLTGYAYAEDLDFSYTYYKHAKRANLKCIMSNKVHVKHMVSREYRTPSRKSTFMYVLNRAYLSKKHKMGLISVLAMDWCNFWRFIELTVKKRNSRDMLDAILYLKKNKREVYKGEFRY